MLEDKLLRHERIRLEALNQAVHAMVGRPLSIREPLGAFVGHVIETADKFEDFIYEGMTERTDDESE